MTWAQQVGVHGLMWLFCPHHLFTLRVSGRYICHHCGYTRPEETGAV